MAKTYKTGLIITGDAKGAIKATALTDAQLKKLNHTQKKGAKQAQQYAGRMAGAVRSLTNYAAVAGGAALLATGALVKSNLSSIDTLAKKADALGITTEALTKYRFAAEQTGMTSDKFDKSLEKMIVNVADAAKGTGEASGALKDMGINVDELIKLSPDQQFAMIADSIKGVENQTERAGVAYDIFGRQGVSLLNTLNLGSEGLAELGHQAEVAGVAISRVDAAKIEAANDSMNRAQQIAKGFGQQLTVQIAPMLDAMASQLFDVASEAGGVGTAAERAFNTGVSVVGVFADGLHGVHVLMKLLETGVQGFAAVSLDMWDKLLRGASELANKIPGISIDYESSSFSRFNVAMQEDFNTTQDELQALLLKELPSTALKNFTAEAQAQSQLVAEAVAKKVAADQAYQKTLGDTGVALDVLNEKDGELLANLKGELSLLKLTDRERAIEINLRKLSADATDKQITQVRDLTGGMYDQQEAAQALADEADPYASAWEEATKRVDDSFATAWEGAFDSFSSFADSLKDSFKKLLAEMAHLAFTKPIVMNIMGSVGGLLGVSGASARTGGGFGLGGGGGGGGLMSNVGSLKSAYSYGSSVYAGYAEGGMSGALYNGTNGLFGGGSVMAQEAALQAQLNAAQGLQASAGTFAGSVTEFSNGVTQAAPWASAITGAYMGYKQNGAKGAVGGAVGGYYGATAGASAGATIGSLAGPVGTAVGGAIGAVVGGFLGSSVGSNMFGGQWETKKSGLALGIEGGDLDAQTYRRREKKGGWFSSSKTSVEYDPISAEAGDSLAASLDATKASILGSFEALGMETSEAIWDGYNRKAQKLNLQGKSEEKAAEMLASWFSGVADGLTREVQIDQVSEQQAIDSVLGSGWSEKKQSKIINKKLALHTQNLEDMQQVEIESYERLTQMANALVGANAALEFLNVGLLDTSIAGAQAAEGLLAAFGGIESFTAGTDAYYQAFYSAEEKFTDFGESLQGQVASLGAVLPDTRDGFRELVEGLDLSTEAVQQQFAGLMGLVPALDQYYVELERQAGALRELSGVGGDWVTYRAEQIELGYRDELAQLQAIQREKMQALQAEHRIARSLVNTVTGLKLGDISPLSAADQLAYAREEFSRVQLLADGGNEEALGNVGGAASRYLKELASYAPNSDLYSGEFAEVTGYLQNLGVSLGAYEDTNSAVERLAQQQLVEQQRLKDLVAKELTYLAGMSGDSSDMVSLLMSLPSDLANALSAIIGGPADTGSLSDPIRDLYASSLGREADAGGNAYWQNELASGKSVDEVTTAFNSASLSELYTRGLGREADAEGLAYWRSQVEAGADFSVLKDSFFKAAAENGENVNSFDVGTAYVSHDQRADIHQGEIIIDRQSSEALRKYGINVQAPTADAGNAELVNEVRALRAEFAQLRQQQAGESARQIGAVERSGRAVARREIEVLA